MERRILLEVLLGCSILLPNVQCGVVLGCDPEHRKRFKTGWPTKLDYGMYWYGPGHNDLEKATGGPSKYYDPTKPTVIDIHGWLGFIHWTKACFRPSTRCDICQDRRPLMDAWYQKGWNVGLFYWDQFSDEPHACDAERKIYANHLSLRWLSNLPEGGENYLASLEFRNFTSSKTATLADLCAENIADVMSDYSGPEVRLVGHSMGTQLAIQCGKILHEMKAKAAPNRLVLSEAAFIFQPRMFADGCDNSELYEGTNFGDFALKKLSDSMAQLRRWGVFTEYIQTLEGKMRLMVDGDVSKDVERQSVSVKYKPDWCSITPTHGLAELFPWICEHDAAHVLYMLSMGNTGPCTAPTAACTIEDIALLLDTAEPVSSGRHREWVQVAGTETIETVDDIFQVQIRNGSAPKVDTEVIQAQLYTDGAEDADTGEPSFRQEASDLLLHTPIGLTLSAVLGCVCLLPFCFFRPCLLENLCCGGKTYSELKCKDTVLEPESSFSSYLQS